ncbi:hypothetical protein C8F04DRAFT_1078608 [Mycena alexandri]|uniref:Uncharacterized protein n=1 Tax=Mycena alexandri TaxID=1745969 RepID=A0AAD6T8F7_9AGAR|nr:hypothetical protein C8F04DRAFT_1078608 [Mycena alexandri]
MLRGSNYRMSKDLVIFWLFWDGMAEWLIMLSWVLISFESPGSREGSNPGKTIAMALWICQCQAQPRAGCQRMCPSASNHQGF